MANVIRIKRSELYRLVWQEPVMHIAERYGLSDVGFAKVCKKHNIPRPPAGYWAQKQHGQTPPQSPLPDAVHDFEIEFRHHRRERQESQVLDSEVLELIKREKQSDFKIEVGQTLRNPHMLVGLASESLQSTKPGADGLLRPEKCALDLRVSRKSSRRALLIMDALLKGLQRRGFEVARGPTVMILGRQMQLSLKEEVDIERVPANEPDLNQPYAFVHSHVRQRHLPSGRFVLAIEHGQAPWARRRRCRWADAQNSPLESRLNEFAVKLIEFAGLAKQFADEQQRQVEIQQRRVREEEALRRERAAQRAAKKQRYDAELARVTQLLKQAEDFERSRLVRSFIEEVKRARHPDGEVPAGSSLAEWLIWATQQADRLDPLRPSPPSILDEPIESDPHEEQWRSRWS